MVTHQGSRRYSRRALLGLAATAGVAALACGGEDSPPGAAESAPPPSPGAGAGTPLPATTGAPVGWRQLRPAGTAPDPRRDHSLTHDGGGRVYLFGGRTRGDQRDDLWAYDLAANAWERLSPTGERPKARFGHNAAYDAGRGRLVVFGGQAGRDFFNDTWAYEASANRWTRLSEAGPSARYGAGGALDPASGRFYLTHGFTFQGRFDDTWAFALGPDAWQDVSPGQARPLNRCLLRSVWDTGGGALLLFGGQSDAAAYMNDLWRLEPGGAWREIRAEPRPSPRHFYAAAFDAAGRRLLVLGGSTQAGEANDLWAFSTASSAWTRLEAAGGLSPRFSHDAVVLPRRRSLLVFGGATASGELNDLWELGLG